MKPVGIFYATREGHTERIAMHLAAAFQRLGLATGVHNVAVDDPEDLSRYCAAVICASVHAGRHEPEMTAFVKQRVAQLGAMPAAFLSVSLSEAGAERVDASADEHDAFSADVDRLIERFFRDTGWTPQHVKPVAGALLYTKYNFLLRLLMRRIARAAGGSTDTSRDHDYTNWLDLDDFVAAFAKELPGDGSDRTVHVRS